jgi:hypothetical protein
MDDEQREIGRNKIQAVDRHLRGGIEKQKQEIPLDRRGPGRHTIPAQPEYKS